MHVDHRRTGHLSRWYLGLVYGLALGLLLAMFGGQTTMHRVASGSFGDWQTFTGWHGPQPFGTMQGRWSEHQAQIHWPAGFDHHTILHLGLIAPDPPRVTLPTTLTIGTDTVVLSVPPEHRVYTIWLPAGPMQQTHPITIASAHTPEAFGVGITVAQWMSARRWRTTVGLTTLILIASALCSHAIRRIWPRSWYAALPPIGAIAAGWIIILWPGISTMTVLLLLGGSLSLVVLTYGVQRTTAPQWWWTLGTITLGAALVRGIGITWDQGYGFHPDEWVFVRASQRLQPPWNPHFFAYGSLLLYLYRLTAAILSGVDPVWLQDFGHYVLIGRWYSAFWGTLTVVVIALLGARWHTRRVGLLAALFWAGCPLAIQQATFATTDSLLTLLFTLMAYGCLRYARIPSWQAALGIGIVIGACVATKVTAILFLLMVLLLLAGVVRTRRQRDLPARVLVRHGLVCCVGAVGTCLVFAPYYLLAWDEFWRTIMVEGRDATSALADYTYQFLDTPPYLYQVINLAWTCGPALILSGLAGWAWVGWRARPFPQAADLVLWLAPAGYFLAIGLSFTKYIRYLLPVLPFLCLYAATALTWLMAARGWRRRAGWWLRLGVTGSTLGYGLAFVVGVYGSLDPRLAASTWIYQHIPPGRGVIMGEEHDVAVPVIVGGRGAHTYVTTRLKVYAPETRESPAYYADVFAQMDYLVIASRSQHVPFRRNPDLFPVRSCIYTALFDGHLGWQQIQRFTRGPTILGWRIDPEHEPWIEETFQVFDHPTVVIFARTPQYSSALLNDRLVACLGE